VCLRREFGVLIGDDDQRGIERRRFPQPLSFGGHPRGPLV
jgi:hypothetical protein